MYKKLIVIVLLFYFSLNAFAQVKVEGLVLSYNDNTSKRIGIQGAIIEKEDKNATTSDTNGYFSIEFSGELDRKQGRLKVSPPREGMYRKYIVMEVDGYHYVDTKFFNITVGRKDSVKVSLCSPEKYEEMVRKLAKPYIDKILKAQEKLFAEEKEMTKARQQFIIDSVKIEVDNYTELAKKFARIDPDLADENFRKAREYFAKGDIDSAKIYLPEYDQAISNIERGKAVVSLWLSVWKTERETNKVQEAYNDMFKYTGVYADRFKLLLEYSEYLFQNRIFNPELTKEALSYAKEAHQLASTFLSPYNVIQSYNLLGKIQQYIKTPKEDYYKNYQEAIKLYKKIKKEHDNEILRNENYAVEKEAAISYTLLGDYFYEQKKKNEPAKTNYHKALDIYTELNQIGEFEAKTQSATLLKLADIYDSENKERMVKKCMDRILLLEKEDRTIIDEPKIILYRAMYKMQNGSFSEADSLYAKAQEHYRKNLNLPQKELIETLFLSGLNQFYTKSYNNAFNFFLQTDTLLKKDSVLLGPDFVRIKALCMATKGIIIKEQSDEEKEKSLSLLQKENLRTDFIYSKASSNASKDIIIKEQGNKDKGLAQYEQAREMVKNSEILHDSDKKLLLKDMAYLKQYSNMEAVEIVKGGVALLGALYAISLPILL